MEDDATASQEIAVQTLYNKTDNQMDVAQSLLRLRPGMHV